MATDAYTANETSWTHVANGAALVELRKTCTRLKVTTSASQPPDSFDIFHTLSALDCRTFSYGGTHGVYIKAFEDNSGGIKPPVVAIVTSDNLA